MAESRAATPADIAKLQTEIGLLTETVRQMIGTLEVQSGLLSALLEAVTAPEGGDGSLAEALARIADSLDDQTEELVAIRADIRAAPGSTSQVTADGTG